MGDSGSNYAMTLPDKIPNPLAHQAVVDGDTDTHPPFGIGVRGHSSFGNSVGFLAGPNPFASGIAIGAYGQSDHHGVVGIANTQGGFGVYGGSVGGIGTGVMGETSGAFGVLGRAGTAAGTGVRGENVHGGLAGEFIGNVDVHGVITMKDNGDIILADCAEGFQLASNCKAPAPGTVMVIEETGAIAPCNTPYDTRVVGVVSGAGSYRPAIVLDAGNASEGRTALSLVGKVYCMVDATFAAIHVGDLLTTSTNPGHAMKATDPARTHGAIIGKALRALEEGSGLIPMLVALQ
jgi:hypothetical protein